MCFFLPKSDVLVERITGNYGNSHKNMPPRWSQPGDSVSPGQPGQPPC